MASDPSTLVERLDAMADGWLCAGLPDADLPREAAREIERLRAVVADTETAQPQAVRSERDRVRIPTSAAEAKAMATVALAWLREHAPDELKPEFRA